MAARKKAIKVKAKNKTKSLKVMSAKKSKAVDKVIPFKIPKLSSL